MTKNLAASVRARLLNIAKSEGSDFNSVLVRYTLERFLYRLSQSEHADKFLLKGALLFTLWYDMPHRATRDVDLLGFGSSARPVLLWLRPGLPQSRRLAGSVETESEPCTSAHRSSRPRLFCGCRRRRRRRRSQR